mmetsp:Transcript_39128/g.28932  ORF Transcript_39128/g.28932 Transcript_39128/m.28932 type:complete len:91 (-) Transcript_39128:49-321(-)
MSEEFTRKERCLQLLSVLNSCEDDAIRMLEIFSASADVLAEIPADPREKLVALNKEYSKLRITLHHKLMEASSSLLLTTSQCNQPNLSNK